MERLITIKNVEKSFGDVKVLKDINLNIEDGEIYGLVGQSGSGKSTLLRCINGLNKHNSGEIKVDNVEISSLNTEELRKFRQNIGMIFQHFSLLERVNVYENVAFPLRLWNYDNVEIDKKVKNMLELVGLEDKIHAKPRELSGGQKQRVAIARALIMNPRYLLSDEATSALDPKIANSIFDLLKHVNEELGITIIVVTHQMEAVKQVCDKVAILNQGEIVADGPVKEIFLKNPISLQNLLGIEASPVKEGHTAFRLLVEDIDEKRFFSDFHRQVNIDYNFSAGGIEKFKEYNCLLAEIEVPDKDEALVKKYFEENDIMYEVR